MKTEMLQIKNVSIKHGNINVINNCNFILYSDSNIVITSFSEFEKNTLLGLFTCSENIAEGEVYFMGKQNILENIRDKKSGYTCINKESKLIDLLSIEDNIFLYNKSSNLSPLPNRRVTYNQTKRLLIKFNLGYLNPNTFIYNLPDNIKHIIEIIKAVISDVKFIVFDDITILYSKNDIAMFMEIISMINKKGIACIFFCNRYSIIQNIADRILLLEKGSIIYEFEKDEFSIHKLSIISSESLEKNTKHNSNKDILQQYTVLNINISEYINNIKIHLDFNLAQKEILGITNNYMNNNIQMLSRLFSGNCNYTGHIRVMGKSTNFNSPYKITKSGVGYISEQPSDYIFKNLSLKDNITTLFNKKFPFQFGLADSKIIRHKYCSILSIYNLLNRKFIENIENTLNTSQIVDIHTIICRYMFSNVKIIVFFEPYINLGDFTSNDFCEIINILKYNEISIIIISADNTILKLTCDRIIKI